MPTTTSWILFLSLALSGCNGCDGAASSTSNAAAANSGSPAASGAVGADGSASVSSARTKERIEGDIKRVETELADLRKRATRTFAQDNAKKIAEQIAVRNKRLEALRAELAEKP